MYNDKNCIFNSKIIEYYSNINIFAPQNFKIENMEKFILIFLNIKTRKSILIF